MDGQVEIWVDGQKYGWTGRNMGGRVEIWVDRAPWKLNPIVQALS